MKNLLLFPILLIALIGVIVYAWWPEGKDALSRK
jgi:hypothetical protein